MEFLRVTFHLQSLCLCVTQWVFLIWDLVLHPLLYHQTGRYTGCKERHKVIWKGSRISDLECPVLNFLKQPSGISCVLVTSTMLWVCVKNSSLDSPVKSHMEEKRGGSRVLARLSFKCSHRKSGTWEELTCSILMDEAAHDSTVPRVRSDYWVFGATKPAA